MVGYFTYRSFRWDGHFPYLTVVVRFMCWAYKLHYVLSRSSPPVERRKTAKLTSMLNHKPLLLAGSAALGALALATPPPHDLTEQTLHGFCSQAAPLCQDNGTITPTTSKPTGVRVHAEPG